MAGAGGQATTAIGSGRHHGQGTSDYDRTTGTSGLTDRGVAGSGTAGSGYGSSGYDRSTGSSGLAGSGTVGSGYGSSGTDNARSTNAGPHSSNLANKADPRVDSDLGRLQRPLLENDANNKLDSSRGTSGLTGSGVGSGTTGSGMTGSGLTGTGTGVGKHGHHGHQGHHGGATGGITGKVEDIVHGGPHDTETANRLDPHVSGGSTTAGGLEHATIPGTSQGTGSTTGTSGGYGSNTSAGPHKSNLLNEADPRVDSDLSGSRGAHGSNTVGSSGLTGTSGGYGSNTTGTTSGYGTNTGVGQTGSTTTGPHGSNLVNKADPRVDSDLSGSRGGYGSNTSGTSGVTGTSNTIGGYSSGSGAGSHDSNVIDKADPRVDSDLSGNRGGYGSSTGTSGGYGTSTGTGHTGSGGLGSNTGSGYNQTSTTGTTNTAGPHNSNLANKVDPRVDSDADGSRLR